MLSIDATHDPIVFFILSCGVFIWSLCLGSFTTAIVPREMNGVSWFSLRGKESRSQCAFCQATLSWRELIPIFSYLLQKRKSKCCGQSIPAFYPITEIIICLLTLSIFAKNGFGIYSLGLTLSLPFFATCFWMGCHQRLASDRMLIVLAYIAVGTALLNMPATDLFQAIYGALIMGVVGAAAKILADKYSSHSFLTWDIVKLWIVIGFWLHATGVGYLLFLIGVGGALWILFPPAILKKHTQSFPYIAWSLLVFIVLTLWL